MGEGRLGRPGPAIHGGGGSTERRQHPAHATQAGGSAASRQAPSGFTGNTYKPVQLLGRWPGSPAAARRRTPSGGRPPWLGGARQRAPVLLHRAGRAGWRHRTPREGPAGSGQRAAGVMRSAGAALRLGGDAGACGGSNLRNQCLLHCERSTKRNKVDRRRQNDALGASQKWTPQPPCPCPQLDIIPPGGCAAFHCQNLRESVEDGPQPCTCVDSHAARSGLQLAALAQASVCLPCSQQPGGLGQPEQGASAAAAAAVALAGGGCAPITLSDLLSVALQLHGCAKHSSPHFSTTRSRGSRCARRCTAALSIAPAGSSMRVSAVYAPSAPPASTSAAATRSSGFPVSTRVSSWRAPASAGGRTSRLLLSSARTASPAMGH